MERPPQFGDEELPTGWVRLPGEIRERALDLRRKIRALNGDIDRAVTAGTINPNSGRYAAWKGYVKGYGDWLAEVAEGYAPDWVKWGWSDVAATVEAKASELRQWHGWFARTAGVPASSPPPPKRTGPADLGSDMPGWVWAALGVAAVWGGASLVGKLRK